MTGPSILCLGAGDGWHSNQLKKAAEALECRLQFATYQSLRSAVSGQGCETMCDGGSVNEFDAILTRTMPAGSLEQVTFRLATLHQLKLENRIAIVNPPRALEIAIDKFATLVHVAKLGYEVPRTIVAQSRADAIDAFRLLGGDCVIKPVFGGEGRGVMRVRDPELAWYTFSTLQELGAVMYVQQFVPPGGRDRRLLVIGNSVIGIRRENATDFRTNISSGSRAEPFDPNQDQVQMAIEICRSIDLKFAAVDLIDTETGRQMVLEVNAIPGWKGAQQVTDHNIAKAVLQLLITETDSTRISKIGAVS